MSRNIALDHEMIDLLVTLAIGFREHKGKAKMVRRVAERIRKRLVFEETQKVCDDFIARPESAEFSLNALTERYYHRQILKIV
ncbi:hypothetical protein MOC16_gp288 [Klebsiella phage vB_KpM_FBKp24]|uniref:Uncharacterized protein n=2 Tax=root TaxID=1 RepID=A0A7U0GBS9_9CAUD|nr:hypothetical protein MOC16_gp288 [Klebsiella phage vB_KpM_FBKp24]QQV92328.1 hypothetical protein vBKpMFBKp24_125 [Klebsiella phage vB_KpM_FBKp24]